MDLRRLLAWFTRGSSRFARAAVIKIRVWPDADDVHAQPVGDVAPDSIGGRKPLNDFINRHAVDSNLARQARLSDTRFKQGDAEFGRAHVFNFVHIGSFIFINIVTVLNKHINRKFHIVKGKMHFTLYFSLNEVNYSHIIDIIN